MASWDPGQAGEQRSRARTEPTGERERGVEGQVGIRDLEKKDESVHKNLVGDRVHS